MTPPLSTKDSLRPTRFPWLAPVLWIGAATSCIPVGATYFLSGKSAAEKLATNMAQPLFLAIVGTLLFGAILWRRGERIIGLSLMVGAAILWCLSAPVLVNRVFAYWESLVPSDDVTADPYDYVVVLGGGTTRRWNGQAQFGESGDRVGYAATLFLSGKAKHLITTGDAMKVRGAMSDASAATDDPSIQTREIWSALGIPKEVIFELPGENTYSEIAALKTHPEWWREKRCALLTSAFHMPRAMRLAKQAGIQLSPIVADYKIQRSSWMIREFMPDSHSLHRLQYIIKEWIAFRMNR
jgi:uncharacterized SAM-binding protein YcdF (DUF218 family)